MKPPGTCSPGQPGLSPEQSSSQPWQPGLPVCVHPSRGGQRPEQLFTLQRQNKSRSNSETKNLSFLAPLLSPLLFSLHQSALLGCVPHCLPQDQSLSPPAPLARRHPHTQRCFCQDGCTTPLSSCFLYITSGLMAGRRRLVSHPGKGKAKSSGGQTVLPIAEDGMAVVRSFCGGGQR